MDGAIVLPEPEGLRPTGRAHAEGDEQTRELKLSSAVTLGDLAQDYVFFTPALLFSTGITIDPVQEHINRQDRPIPVATVRFDNPIFDRIPAPNDRTLWLCPREDWPPLDDSLRAVSILNRQEGWLASAYRHVVEIADPLLLEKSVLLPSPVPTVEVIVYGVMGPGKTYYIAPARIHGLDRPSVMCGPSPETQLKLSHAVLTDADNPFEELER